MDYFNIAGLNVALSFKGETLAAQTACYRLEGKPEKIDITVDVSDKYIEEKHREYPHMSINDCEYMWTGAAFYEQLLNYGGFMLHASGVVMDGKAYLFSAPSGTGKSTHTTLWLKVFGDRAEILNDDKPAIRTTADGVFAYGTPWSGKTALNINVCADLQGICFLERSEENHISEISSREAIGMILDQTIRPLEISQMDKLLDCIDKLLKNVRVYKMGCNMNDEAAKLSYKTMNGGVEK